MDKIYLSEALEALEMVQSDTSKETVSEAAKCLMMVCKQMGWKQEKSTAGHIMAHTAEDCGDSEAPPEMLAFLAEQYRRLKEAQRTSAQHQPASPVSEKPA